VISYIRDYAKELSAMSSTGYDGDYAKEGFINFYCGNMERIITYKT